MKTNIDPMTMLPQPLFEGLTHLTKHLRSHVHHEDGYNPKSIPIVLVPGFLGWSAPLLGGSLNYFGGFVNLADILAKQGWSVICPQVGPVSSNWERACEVYAQLSRGSFDGSTYDLVVDYGNPPPGTDIVYHSPPPFRKQAIAFNLDPDWRWGPDHPVHFIAHSQGGNTVRYLIHLLDNGWKDVDSSYFRGPKHGWVKSLTTLATPHNGSSIIDALEDLGPAEDVLMDQLIATAAFLPPHNRGYDFCLDHRGVCPPLAGTPEATNFLAYLAKMTGPDGALTKWRKTNYTGFYANSILGAMDMNKTVSAPSKDVYYFTLSFAATIPVPKFGIEKDDIYNLPNPLESILPALSPYISWVPPLHKIPIVGSFIGGSNRAHSNSNGNGSDKSSFLLTLFQSTFGDRLQDINSWAIKRINSRLPADFPKIPLPGTTMPRVDLFPAFLVVAPGMGGFELKEAQRKAVAEAGGNTDDDDWHEHDGVVPTISMRAPWGNGNHVVTVDEVIQHHMGLATNLGGGRRGEVGTKALKGVWVDLGKCPWLDHADCIGSGINPIIMLEVIELYKRISDLMESLPI